ncbi:MAG: chromate transporter [Kiritimatiellaeota bacterium]|nr:chromate transporter [Kiritimatiellota bacterium]
MSQQEKLTTIFWSFLKIGAVLFGGGYAMLPLLENEIVRRRKWCSHEEMSDTFAMAQLIPGVVAINTAMLVGHQLRGARGTIAATLGVVGVPFAVLLAYAIAFDRFREARWLLDATAGLRPAVAGMMLGMAYTLFTRARKTRLGLAVSLAAVALVLVFKVSAVAVILGGAGGGIIWHLLSSRIESNRDGSTRLEN